jgi:photosystem II stability/assembly factor-like uncharacterized protein
LKLSIKRLNRFGDLIKAVRAGVSSTGLSGTLNRWQQQPHERADDGDHHEQLDKREGLAAMERMAEHRSVLCMKSGSGEVQQ